MKTPTIPIKHVLSSLSSLVDQEIRTREAWITSEQNTVARLKEIQTLIQSTPTVALSVGFVHKIIHLMHLHRRGTRKVICP